MNNSLGCNLTAQVRTQTWTCRFKDRSANWHIRGRANYYIYCPPYPTSLPSIKKPLLLLWGYEYQEEMFDTPQPTQSLHHYNYFSLQYFSLYKSLNFLNFHSSKLPLTNTWIYIGEKMSTMSGLGVIVTLQFLVLTTYYWDNITIFWPLSLPKTIIWKSLGSNYNDG